MPSLARTLVRRHLPHRIRAAGLELLGRRPVPPVPRRPFKSRTPKKARPKRQRVSVPPPVPASALVTALRHGRPVAEAVALEVRALLAQQRRGQALSVATALRNDPATDRIGDLAAGIVAEHGGYLALAWSHLAPLPPELWTRYAAREYARAGLDQDPDSALRTIRELLAADADDVPAAAWLEILGPVFGYGDHELVQRLFALLDARVGDGSGVDTALVVNRDWLRPWVAASPDGRSAPPVAAGVTSFAIMAYGHPGRSRASANIGDHVQSLASLGHLARHQDLDYDGPQDLVDLMTQLRSRVRPEQQRRGIARTVELIQVDRDASMYAAIPPRHLDPGVRLVHARDLRDPLRLPVPPQPAADLRVVPLQQARPADRGGRGIPAAVRSHRLPRLDHGRRAAVGRSARVLLRVPDHHRAHRVPRSGGPPERLRACRLRRHAGDGGPEEGGDLPAQQRRGSGSALSRPMSTTPSSCWRRTGASTVAW